MDATTPCLCPTLGMRRLPKLRLQRYKSQEPRCQCGFGSVVTCSSANDIRAFIVATNNVNHGSHAYVQTGIRTSPTERQAAVRISISVCGKTSQSGIQVTARSGFHGAQPCTKPLVLKCSALGAASLNHGAPPCCTWGTQSKQLHHDCQGRLPLPPLPARASSNGLK